MSTTLAPVWVAAQDLTVELMTLRQGTAAQERLIQRAETEAMELTCALALALTFPKIRARERDTADQRLVRVREMLRLMERANGLSAGRARVLHDRVDEIGRMIGGWKRRSGRR